MAKKRDPLGDVVIPAAAYQKLSQTMEEYIFRGPVEEAVVMRLAKAAGLTDVIARIVRLRRYAKNRSEEIAQGEAAEAPKPRRKRKKPQQPPATGGEGATA